MSNEQFFRITANIFTFQVRNKFNLISDPCQILSSIEAITKILIVYINSVTLLSPLIYECTKQCWIRRGSIISLCIISIVSQQTFPISRKSNIYVSCYK